MTTRRICKLDGTVEEQELNELASLIADFCDRSAGEWENTKETNDYAAGYYQAVNTMRTIINGLPKAMICN